MNVLKNFFKEVKKEKWNKGDVCGILVIIIILSCIFACSRQYQKGQKLEEQRLIERVKDFEDSRVKALDEERISITKPTFLNLVSQAANATWDFLVKGYVIYNDPLPVNTDGWISYDDEVALYEGALDSDNIPRLKNVVWGEDTVEPNFMYLEIRKSTMADAIKWLGPSEDELWNSEKLVYYNKEKTECFSLFFKEGIFSCLVYNKL